MRKFLIAVVAMCLAAPVFAQEMEPSPITEAAHNAVAAYLRLSDEQIAAWDEIYQIHRAEEQPLKEDVAAVQQELDELFEIGNPDPAEVGALTIERRALGEMLFEVHLIYHEDFVALLDDNQVRRLKFIARADDVQRFIPAFKLFELIPRR